MLEIPNLEITKQNLDYLNSDLEKDLLRLDEANQDLLRQIQEKEETIQRSVFVVGEKKGCSTDAPRVREVGGRFTFLVASRAPDLNPET